MRSFAQSLLLFCVAGLFSLGAQAQVSGDHFNGYPLFDGKIVNLIQLNASHCDATTEANFWWRLSAEAPLYKASLLLFKSGGAVTDICPTWIQRTSREHEVLIDSVDATPNASNVLDLKYDFLASELMGEDACETPFIRDLGRTLCLYLVNINGVTEEFATNEGLPVDVDTRVPNAPEGIRITPADSKLTVYADDPDVSDGDTLSAYVGIRPCGDDDGGTLVVDSGAAESAEEQEEEDAGLLDAGTMDAGSATDAGLRTDAGTTTDAGATDAGFVATSDAGETASAVSVDVVLDVGSSCGSSEEYVFSEVTATQVVNGLTLTGLTNDTQYEVAVVFVDDFGNISEASEQTTSSPIAALDAIDLYEGGKDPLSFNPVELTEGCTARNVLSKNPPFSSLMLLAGLGLLLTGRLRRRSRLASSMRGNAAQVLGVFFALGISASASAYPGQLDLRLQAGPYSPALDLETVGGKAIFPIYNCLFDDAVSPRIEGDVSVHLFDGFGSLQVGFGLGLTQVSGKAQPVSVLDDYRTSGALTCADNSAVTTTVELTQLTMRPSLIYNFDFFLDAFAFPIVPYARIGLLGSLYGFTKDAKFTESSLLTDRNRAGLRLGIEGALGLMLALDFLENVPLLTTPGGRISRANGFFNHSFFSFEIVAQDVTTFGQPGPNLSPMDMVFQTKLPLFFNFGVVVEFS